MRLNPLDLLSGSRETVMTRMKKTMTWEPFLSNNGIRLPSVQASKVKTMHCGSRLCAPGIPGVSACGVRHAGSALSLKALPAADRRVQHNEHHKSADAESQDVANTRTKLSFSPSKLQDWSGSAIRRGAIAALAAMQLVAPFHKMDLEVANAILYSPDTKVPRSAEVALRRAIPAVNPTIKAIQEALENIFYLLRIPQRKPYSSMQSDVKKALKLAVDDKTSIMASLPEAQRDKGLQLYNSLLDGKTGLAALLDSIANQDADKVSIKLASSLDTIAQLELLQELLYNAERYSKTEHNSFSFLARFLKQAPGLPYLLPTQYQQYPRLTGRAVVELTVEKGDGSNFTVAAGQGPQQYGTIEVVLDGYSAPLTAGNFANKILKGVYNGVQLRRTEQAVLSDNELNDVLPMEILPAGEFQPLYRTTLNIQDGELPVLPLSVYGAVAMSHASKAEDSSSASQFFFYLYDKRTAGLGGLSFDEGQFSVFGYVTKGKELLSQLKTGDVIGSAKLVSGADRLVFPEAH